MHHLDEKMLAVQPDIYTSSALKAIQTDNNPIAGGRQVTFGW